VILVVGGVWNEFFKRSEWYDPKMNQWHFGPEMITCLHSAAIEVMNDNLVFAVGGIDKTYLKSVAVLDLSLKSLCWKPSVDMLTRRYHLGVGVINNYLYAVSNVELEFISLFVV